MKTKLDRIIKNELCLGCGLCESLGGAHGYVMEMGSNGFYYTRLPPQRDRLVEEQIANVCPSINLLGTSSSNAWGIVKNAGYAFSKDDELRFKGSSGGAISGICLYLLENKVVDGILHIGRDRDNPLLNRLYISKRRDEIMANSSSRYAPALVLDRILQMLGSNQDSYAFIGKPCDILAIKNLAKLFPYINERIKLFVSIICAGIPSLKATEELLKRSGRPDRPVTVQYRGNGWPGMFRVTYSDGSYFSVPYAESWMNYLGRQTHFRCKICPDGVGYLADIAAGDGWETRNGYPDFEERPGRSFVLVRTDAAARLIEDMRKSGDLAFDPFDISAISVMQPYQFRRTLTAGYRIFPVQMLTGGLLRIRKLKLLSKMRRFSFLRGCKDSIGTFKRTFHRNEY